MVSESKLVPIEAVEAAIQRVMAVYGVSDVVVDAFDQLRKELKQETAARDRTE